MTPVEWFAAVMGGLVLVALVWVVSEYEEDAERRLSAEETPSAWSRFMGRRTKIGRAVWVLAGIACLSVVASTCAELLTNWETLDPPGRLSLVARISLFSTFFAWNVVRVGDRPLAAMMLTTTALFVWARVA